MVFLPPVKKTQMAKKNIQQTESAIDNVDATLNKAEQFIEKNLKQVAIGLGVILVIILGYWGYGEYIVNPLEEEAQHAIFPAQRAVTADSLRLAVDGNIDQMGFVEVADEYSSTKAGNLANYYAGMCYLQLGEFENAIEFLDKFSSNDGVLNVQALGGIGDAFHELNQPSDALDYYTKAANLDGNEFSTPIVLKKAAQTAEMLEEWNSALKMYKRLQTEFPDAQESREIEKFIAYCEQKANA